VFPTDRLDTSDPAAVREYAARYLVPIIGQAGRWVCDMNVGDVG
jgi:hypothetical protein